MKCLSLKWGGDLKLVAVFSPYWDSAKENSQDLQATTAAPLKAKELFTRDHLGPHLEIYELKV